MQTDIPFKKIKLAIVETNLVIGGVQKLVLDQLRVLDRNQFDIHLIVLMQPDRADFYSMLPSDIQLTKLYFKSPRDISSWVQLIKVLRKFSPDVVKSSMYFSNTVVCLLKSLIGYRVITAEHNTNDGKNSLQRKINRFLNRLSYTTVVDSNMVADYLSETEKLPRDRFTVIHNGVDITAIEESRRLYCSKRDVLRAEFGVASDEKLFLTIGRMVRQKNHLRMVDAFALLVKSRPNCKLMIIGDGGFKDEIELSVKQLGVSDKVILLGSRKDIHQFYVMSDITLLSSDHEGFCIAAMEGLAFGAPLVSTRVAGVVEYLEDGKNGFFAEKTPEDLAEKMGKIVILSESNFIDFQENSRRTALNYSLESYNKRLTKLFIDCYNS